MQLAHHIEALQNDLNTVAALGDEASSQAAQRMAQALEPALRLRLLDLLTEAAAEVSAQLPNGRVEARLTGSDVELSFVEEEPPAAAIPPDDPMSARITLRLPEGLKGLVEAAAALEGTSANSWLVQTIARNAQHQRPRTGRRLTGYGKS